MKKHETPAEAAAGRLNRGSRMSLAGGRDEAKYITGYIDTEAFATSWIARRYLVPRHLAIVIAAHAGIGGGA